MAVLAQCASFMAKCGVVLVDDGATINTKDTASVHAPVPDAEAEKKGRLVAEQLAMMCHAREDLAEQHRKLAAQAEAERSCRERWGESGAQGNLLGWCFYAFV